MINYKGGEQMATLKDTAKDFVPRQVKNIAELPVVDVNLEVMEGKATDKDGKEFTYKYVDINGEEYRVPEVVLRDLKAVLDESPNLTKFKVKRTGEGLRTRYTLLPLN